MRRREFITLLGGAAVAWPLTVRAQQAGKVWRIGILDTATRELNTDNLAAFYKGLRDFGYVEGQNLIIEYRSANDRIERLPDLVSELLRRRFESGLTAPPGQIDGSSSTWRQCTSCLRFMLRKSLPTTED